MSLDEQIKEAVHTYISAFENRDLEAIMGIYAEDCWIEDPVGSERKVGRAALREFYKVGVEMGVRLTLVSEIGIAGNEAAFAFRLEADTPQGKMILNSIDVMVFNEAGKVTSMRAFFGPGNRRFES
ncbi:MAG: nuclear transport factor 2 family protein [Myxococcota bacterium]